MDGWREAAEREPDGAAETDREPERDLESETERETDQEAGASRLKELW